MTFVDPPPTRKTGEDRSWLTWPVEPVDDGRKPIHRSGLSSRPGKYAGTITLENLSPKEIEAIEGFLNGTQYIKIQDGRLHTFSVYEEYPTPEPDPICGPHWSKFETPVKWSDTVTHNNKWDSPALILHGLAAGVPEARYEKEYKKSADTLTRCGFECLRSRRALSGQYWEYWVLYRLSGAKGPLKKLVDEFPGKWDRTARVEEACRFITHDLGVRYGSLDATVQRWALCCED